MIQPYLFTVWKDGMKHCGGISFSSFFWPDRIPNVSAKSRKILVEIPLDESRIIRNLEVGNPIICVVGPGDFTTTGHFIVMTEYIDGKIKINDPNSRKRSNQLWEYADIEDQIINLWVCRL